MIYPSLFKNKYATLRGRDWLKRIEPEDLKVFISIGMKHHDYGRIGGKIRAATAKRNEKGKFVK